MTRLPLGTPAAVEFILSAYYKPGFLLDGEPMSPAHESYLNSYHVLGLLKATSVGFEMTSKGRAYVKMIIETPMPVTVFMDPRDPRIEQIDLLHGELS